MKIYVCLEGGCMQWVATDAPENVEVELIDMDDYHDETPEHRAEIKALMDEAENLPRVW